MELAGYRAADLAGVGLHGTILKPAALANALVGRIHLVVFFLQRLLGIVEAVAILHDELAAAQQAEARANLVAELRLNLIHVQRQLLVRAQLGTHQRRDELLVRGAEAELVVVAIVQAHALGTVRVGAAGFLPQLCRLYRRHMDLLTACSIHFLTDDVLDLTHGSPSQRHKAVYAGNQLADHACPQQEHMARDFRFIWNFTKRL